MVFPVQSFGQVDSVALIVEAAAEPELRPSLPLIPYENVGTWKHLIRVTAYIHTALSQGLPEKEWFSI